MNETIPEWQDEPESLADATDADDRRAYGRRRKLFFLALLLGTLSACLLCVVAVGAWTMFMRQPVTALPAVDALARAQPPHYLFSIFNVSQPIGVGFSPDGERIFVAESAGERLVRVFTREGKEMFSFAPPGTTAATRTPAYLAVAGDRVYVVDRMQHAIVIFDLFGKYVDTIYAPGQLLSAWVDANKGDKNLPPNRTAAHLVGDTSVRVLDAQGWQALALPAPSHAEWRPLGVRVFDDTLYITDVTNKHQRVITLDLNTLGPTRTFGHEGAAVDQFEFPNVAVVDALGRMIVSDGNNGRLVIVDDQDASFIFAKGTSEGALALPGGMAIDAESRLYVVDSVNQGVHVYDVSSPELRYLFAFGMDGAGAFNFPTDIALDATGRLAISDTMNDRVQVWSY
ncbi:MAG: hypothetical protein HY782_28505 [Chloroflexi bacterium]|nr:hypothetical protein [Chloroflexota bacterium]